MNANYDVDELYKALGITKANNPVRNTINTGTMNKKLNTDFSSVVGNRKNTILSNSAKMR